MLPRFWVSRRILLGFKGVDLKSGVQNSGLVSGWVDGLCQRYESGYDDKKMMDSWSYIAQAQAGWDVILPGIQDDGLTSGGV